jgi:hypothetical protein
MINREGCVKKMSLPIEETISEFPGSGKKNIKISVQNGGL